jgi:hypothetical protein
MDDDKTVDDTNRKPRATATTRAPGARRRSTRAGARKRAEKPSKEAVRQAAAPEDAANIAVEAVGEEVGDAPADVAKEAERPDRAALRQAPPTETRVSGTVDAVPAAGLQAARIIPRLFDEQPWLMMLAGFALGYVAAFLLHGRR